MPSIPKIMERFNQYSKTPLKKLKLSHFEANQKIDQDFVFDVKRKSFMPTFRQMKYIGKFYSQTEKFTTKLAFSFILISIAALGFITYKLYTNAAPALGGEYVEALIGAPTYINPLFSQTNDIDQDIVRLVFSSLMKTDQNGQLKCDLV